MLTWRFGVPEDFVSLCELFRSSGLGEGFPEISRRITIPLFLRQLITFHEGSRIVGFVTFAYLSSEAEAHMADTGIAPKDWRSGDSFWAVDFASEPGADGYRMLRVATRVLRVKRARYYRKKDQKVKEVRTICQVAA